VDIRPDTNNIDETKIEAAITPKTKAIVPVHYAGVACEMDTIMAIAERHHLLVIEDAAQGMMSTYKGKTLGTIGHLGAYSFHETKNYTSGGEGGLLILNEERFWFKAEVMREKGTNRSQFFRGQVDKYTWVDMGSSYLPSELQAAFLWGQLEKAEEINQNRLATWSAYYQAFKPLEQPGLVDLPIIPADCEHNAHMFYLKLKDLEQRTAFIDHLKAKDIMAVFHYIPLHSAPAGQKFGEFNGTDQYTTTESERLVRLPMFFGIPDEIVGKVIDGVVGFFK
jgi:dTDP-4-amino-4,6-dideoxygalactose transaminase